VPAESEARREDIADPQLASDVRDVVQVAGSVSTSYLAAVHIQDTGSNGQGSAWVGDTPGGTGQPHLVPESSTMALAALGAVGFLGYGLRRRLKK
jgi:hypothetical protein